MAVALVPTSAARRPSDRRVHIQRTSYAHAITHGHRLNNCAQADLGHNAQLLVGARYACWSSGEALWRPPPFLSGHGAAVGAGSV